ncbi:PQQ-binding-like beta-propeller repeat protein [Chondromyces crocatus]|uniref:Quinonprotein n=1 Tax=Chondromyces crocatus TaxID=52 RepID=A0A0K1EJE9_CHOCO|nr:PQQ-binding-like beta-propeller repeat protein [Chondromyces crocatus]AKT40708.1 quinonprotein [Chondromyces crocatus]
MRWCKGCAAAVEGEPSENVRCPQCGADNPPLQLPPAVSPAVRMLAVGGMVALALGFAVLFFIQVEPPPDGTRPSRGALSARTPSRALRGLALEVYRDDLCFVDANGDGTLDPVVWMSDGKDQSRVAVVDGRTGEGIWASPAGKGRHVLGCADTDTILAGAGHASLRALDARTGAERWSVDLPGQPEALSVGEGCITVLSRGGVATGLQRATGAMIACPSAPTPDAFAGPRWDRTKNPRLVPVGELSLRLSAATEGAPKLTLEALKAGTVVWTRPLDARAPGASPELMLVVAGGIVIVAGSDGGGAGRMRFVGIDVGSGNVLYERPAGWAGPHIPAMDASDGRLVVIAGGSLRAIDIPTGEEAWQAVAPASLP